MKSYEIKVGKVYTARVRGQYTRVRVDAIKSGVRAGFSYEVTDLETGKPAVFGSAAKFRAEVTDTEAVAPAGVYNEQEDNNAVQAPVVVPVCQPATVTPTSAPVASLGLASRIAAMREARSTVPATVAGYTPTPEQRTILETVLRVLEGDGPQVLVIEAGAGAGKTSTLKMLEEILPGSGQYTAFNKSLVDDSRPKFKKARCNTTHSLAFMPVGRLYGHRLNGDRIRSSEVATMLGINDMMVELQPLAPGSDAYIRAAERAGYDKDNPAPADFNPRGMKVLTAAFLAGQVSQALKRFAQSADHELSEDHIAYIDGIDERDANGKRQYNNNNKVRNYLLPFCQRAWQDVTDVNGSFPFTHDYYVKIWQMGTPVIGASYILLDEDQDTAPVFADIIKRQTQALVVLVGDGNQRIYGWRGAINATELFPDAPICYLTQSFRFGQTVADVANSILAGLEEPTVLRMRGIECPTRVLMGAGDNNDNDTAEYVGKVCYLYRTNAGALGRILSEFDQGRRGCLIGKIDEIVKFVKGALALQNGKRTDCPDLAVFESWGEVQRYAEEDPDGADLKLMVKLCDTYGCQNILTALDNMPSEERADFVASTAHKSKGREWDTVVLGTDFPPACDMNDDDRRLLYVAATRAKLVLDLAVCTPFHDYTDKLTGDTTPGITVSYTVPMPNHTDLTAWIAKKAEAKKAEASAPKVTPVASQTAAPTAPAATGPVFSYANISDQWCVRGPAGYENKEVTVTLKNGSKRTELLKKKVKTIGEHTFYEK